MLNHNFYPAISHEKNLMMLKFFVYEHRNSLSSFLATTKSAKVEDNGRSAKRSSLDGVEDTE